MTSYYTVNQWAIKKSTKNHSYTSFSDYANINDYPEESNLQEMFDEMTDLMNDEIGTTGTNITDPKYLTLLGNICYRGVELMMDEEQGRAGQKERMGFVPKDYMYERDRTRLIRIGTEKGYRSAFKVRS